MQVIKEKILLFLHDEGIDVEYFNDPIVEDTFFDKPAELAIRIEEETLPRWYYFAEKLNKREVLAELAYSDGILRFIFQSYFDENGESIIEQNLEEYYQVLTKKYFKVYPSVKYFSVLPKPTHRCNLDCKYCYDKTYRDSIKEDMSMDTLDKLMKLISEYTEKVHIIWHGGEPTMVGIDWYRKAYDEVISKYPMLEIESSMMSNGINFDDKWLELFEKYNISSGISYNAHFQTQLRCSNQLCPEQEIDFNRSKKIEEMLKCMKGKGYCTGVIDVVTELNYKHQIETYEFYKELGISVCMNQVFHTELTEKNQLELSAKKYSKEFLKFFKYWLFDKNGIHERTACEFLQMVIGNMDNIVCTHDDCRYKWLGFNPRGDLYPCDRYYPDKYKMGNIHDFNSIQDIFKTEPYQLYCSEIQKRFDTKCKECGYHFACRGGCNGSAQECTGNCEGVYDFACEMFRLAYKGVYDILRDVDWIANENINPRAREKMMEKGFYSVKEIKEFINNNNIDFELIYDKDDLLECSEYQIFRGINYMSYEADKNRHIDIVNGFDEETKTRNKRKRVENLKEFIRELASIQ